MKRKRNIAVISIVGFLCLLLVIPFLISAKGGDEFDIAGSWIFSLPVPTVEQSMIWTTTLTPLDPAGKKLAYFGYTPNPMIWNPLFQNSRVAGAAVGEFVRTAENTYDFTIIAHTAEAAPVGSGRGLITWFWVWSGTAYCTGENTFYKEGTFSLFSAQDIGPGPLMNQDMDHNGFPDEGAVPFAQFPWNQVYQRVQVKFPY